VLRHGLGAVHLVSPLERAEAILRDGQLAMVDAGERALWSHVLTRTDAWLLCGPDAASLRIGVRLGLRDRLVALEELLSDVGHKPKVPLRRNYTKAWHAERIARLAVEEGKGPA